LTKRPGPIVYILIEQIDSVEFIMIPRCIFHLSELWYSSPPNSLHQAMPLQFTSCPEKPSLLICIIITSAIPLNIIVFLARYV
jgi:hypothetical protein